MTRQRRRGCLLLALSLTLLLGPARSAGALSNKERQAVIETLAPRFREWLEIVRLILTDTELDTFLGLQKDYQRDAFIEQFWRSRDTYPDTARNEFRETWTARAEEAKARFGTLDGERAKMLLLNGEPAGILKVDCTVLWPLEIWLYDRNARIRDRFYLVFYRRANHGPYRLWQPADGLGALTKFLPFSAPAARVLAEIDSTCLRSDEVVGVLSALLRRGPLDYAMLVAALEEPPRENLSDEWIATFNTYTTDFPEGAATFDAGIEISFPGRHQNRTLVQTAIAVAADEAGVADFGGQRSYNFVLTGEVLRGDKLFESFRYRFNFPAAQVSSDRIPLLFERPLRPGAYRMVLKLEDLNSHAVFRREIPLQVPSVEAVAPAAPTDPETARLLAEANAAISTGDTTIQLVEPFGQLQTGLVRFDTLTTGPGIAGVTFALDGRPILTKKRPPYSVELDLGSLPRMHTLSVTAFDAAGNELAQDELKLNAGSHRFSVRLAEPRPGKRYTKSLRALAEVDVPEGQAVERVEFYLNETLVATLYQPPYEQPILLPDTEQVAYVRAVAYQPDGNSTESVVFINAPDYLEEVNVQFVELYISVTDKQNRPVDDLTREDFRVLEDGVLQTPVRFERVSNLPIHAGVLLDISASMDASLEEAKLAALSFFQHAITPKDRAALLTFNDHPQLAVKFTNDLKTLAGGLAGLKAERGTALYDSLIFALYYFNGIKGQRALILLSDGKDENSRFTFEDTLEYARRAGVALYAIGLDLPKSERSLVKRELTKLASETGGRSFFVRSAAELPAIYDSIQRELRSRYYLAYQSTNVSTDGAFRSIEVKVLRPGLAAKTLRGYYP